MLEGKSKCADDLLEEMQMTEWGMRRRGCREPWSGGGGEEYGYNNGKDGNYGDWGEEGV